MEDDFFFKGLLADGWYFELFKVNGGEELMKEVIA